MSEITLGELFTVSLFSGIEKVRIRELGDGRSVKIFRSNCLVSKCRKFSERNPCRLCFRNFPVAKFMDKREGEVSRFSAEKFLSNSSEKSS